MVQVANNGSTRAALASIRPSNAANAAEHSQLANAAAQLPLRGQPSCKAYRSRSVGTQGEAPHPDPTTAPAPTEREGSFLINLPVSEPLQSPWWIALRGSFASKV